MNDTGLLPFLLPTLITLICCILTPAFFFSNRKESIKARLFAIVSLFILIVNLAYLCVLTCSSDGSYTSRPVLISSLFLMIFPASIHLIQHISGISTRIVPFFYLMSIFLTATFALDTDIQGHLSFYAGGIAIMFAYGIWKTAYLSVRYHTREQLRHRTLFYSGVLILMALGVLNLFFEAGVLYYPPLLLAFIPLILIAFGLTARFDSQDNTLQKALLSLLILGFSAVPLAALIILGLINITELHVSACIDWLMKGGYINIVALIITVSLTFFILKRATFQIEIELLSLMCIILIVANVGECLQMLLSPGVAGQAVIVSDIVFVNLSAIMFHLFHVVTGQKRTKSITAFYLISLMASLLIIINIFVELPHALNLSGFSLTCTFRHAIYKLTLLVVLIYSWNIVLRSIKKQTDHTRKKQQGIIFAGISIAILILGGSFLSAFGFPEYNAINILALSTVLFALGILYQDLLSRKAKRRLFSNLLRLILFLIYGSLGTLSLIILKDYTLGHIYNSIIPYGIPPLLSFSVAFLLSLLVLGFEQNRTETLVFSIICFCFSLLNLDILLLAIITDEQLALQISRVDHFFLSSLVLACMMHLTFLMCKANRGWWPVYLAYAVGAVMAPLSQTRYYFEGMYNYYWGFFAKKAILYDVMSTLWVSGLIFSIYILIQAYRDSSNPNQKSALKYIIYGFIAATILSLLNTPAIYGYEIYPLGTFIFISLTFLAYGLFRNNLIIALEHIRTMLLWIGLFSLLGTSGYISYKIFPIEDQNIKLVVGLLVALALYSPVRLLWSFVLNIFIPSTTESLKIHYHSLTQRLSQLHDMQKIHQMISHWFFRILFCSRCTTVFINVETGKFSGWSTWNPQYFTGLLAEHDALPEKDDPIDINPGHPLMNMISSDDTLIRREQIEKWMLKLNMVYDQYDLLTQAELIIPLFFKNNINTVFILSAKLDDTSYSKAECTMIQDFGVVLGPHIENVQLLEGLQEEVVRRTKDLGDALVVTMSKEKEIKEINNIITRQNQSFRSLLQTSTIIHGIWNLDEVFSFTLNQLHELFTGYGFGIILEVQSVDIVDGVYFIGIPEKEQKVLLDNKRHLHNPKIGSALNRALYEKIDEEDKGKEPPEWSVLPMQIGSEKPLGYMIVKAPSLDHTSMDVIAVYLGQISSAVQNKILMSELEKMASSDGLTGAYNRAFFDQELQKAVEISYRYKVSFSVIMIDVNGLKKVNDEFGHEKGDEMIILVANMLKGICRKLDIVSRLGGDEFAILLPSTSYSDAEVLIDRIRNEEKNLGITCINPDGTKQVLPVRICIGMSSSIEVPPDEVLNQADRRMYIDKEAFYKNKTRYR